MSFRVLHVEDDEAQAELVASVLARQLKDEDYVYRRVGRLSEALAALDEGCVDVVVLDLTLEDSTGIGTIRSIVEKCPATPVVVLTGEESLGIAKDAIKAGADSYLRKEFVGALPLVILITVERWNLKAKLSEACAFYRSVVEDSPDCIVRFRPSGKITFANSTLSALVGIPQDELAGRNIRDFIPRERIKWHDEIVASLSVSDPVAEGGEWEVGGRWFAWRKAGIFDYAGRLVEIQAVGRDVTHNHMQAKELIELTKAAVFKMQAALEEKFNSMAEIQAETDAMLDRMEATKRYGK